MSLVTSFLLLRLPVACPHNFGGSTSLMVIALCVIGRRCPHVRTAHQQILFFLLARAGCDSRRGMASPQGQLLQMEKWLASAKALQPLAAYEKLRDQQLELLSNRLQGCELTMEQATDAMQSIASSQHWSSNQNARLADLLSTRVMAVESVPLKVCANGRSKQQDFSNFLPA